MTDGEMEVTAELPLHARNQSKGTDDRLQQTRRWPATAEPCPGHSAECTGAAGGEGRPVQGGMVGTGSRRSGQTAFKWKR